MLTSVPETSFDETIKKHFFQRKFFQDSTSLMWRYYDFREIAWFINGLRDAWDIDLDTWRCIDAIAGFCEFEGSKLFIDFSRIRALGHIKHVAAHHFNPRCTVAFWGLQRHLPDKIRSSCEGASRRPSIDSADNIEFLIWGSLPHANWNDIARSLSNNELVQLQSLILSSFTRFQRPPGAPESVDGEYREILKSTPISTNGIYNAQKLIGRSADFMRISLHLSQECNDFALKSQSDLEMTLLVVSPRGASFTGALSKLCGMPFEIGSSHTRPSGVDRRDFKSDDGRGYIFVADFIVGGTELRIAEALVGQGDSKLLLCVCLATYCKDSIYQRKGKPEIRPILSELSKRNGAASYRFAD